MRADGDGAHLRYARTALNRVCSHYVRVSLVLFGAVAIVSGRAETQSQQSTYLDPPDAIKAILDAERTPDVLVSPTRAHLAILHHTALPSITELTAPSAWVAGIRVDVALHANVGLPRITSIELRNIGGTLEREIHFNHGETATVASWSPKGSHLAIVVRGDSSLTLWMYDVRSGAMRRLAAAPLSELGGAPCQWVTESSLVCRLVVMGPSPGAGRAERSLGPVVQESDGRALPNATFQGLLASDEDDARFAWFYNVQLGLVTTSGRLRRLGSPDLFASAMPSPDGGYLFVQRRHRPFSHRVPVGGFPTSNEIWTVQGQLVRVLEDVPARERGSPSPDAVPTGMRSIAWRSDEAATLVWVEAVVGADSMASVRDRVRMLRAPFQALPTRLVDLEWRLQSITWCRADLAIVEEAWRASRRVRTWSINPSVLTAPPDLLFDRSSEDRYGDPGFFVTAPGLYGRSILLTTPDGRSAYLEGAGASPTGDRPFVNRIDLLTKAIQPTFRSDTGRFEVPVAILGPTADSILMRSESPAEPPNFVVQVTRTGVTRPITHFGDPAPGLSSATERLIKYSRDDGVQLSGMMYLPAGYDSTKGPIPFLIWAYPDEYRSNSAASQVNAAPHAYIRPSADSPLLLLTQGYGVLLDASMPIVGAHGAQPNDTFVKQLEANARAAVEALVSRGVADRGRIAIGGHSYGAFMAANLLAHTKLFRAGVAQSGAYNRTLTPFGFQSESRTFWNARDVYLAMSPFISADSIRAPLLLIHGLADDNSGTFPLQSERLYDALVGQGKIARLVELPGEGHFYRSREGIGQVQAEVVRWLDRFLKNSH